MAVNLSPYGGVGAQFLDNSGNVLTGGKIYTYAAGTTTPQATYTSATGLTALANPIILDAAGRVPTGEIWLTDSLLYKFVLKDSNDVLIATYDNISGINSNFVNYSVQEEIQTATAGQTIFNLATINYQPGTNSLSVFVDGVNQYDGVSYAYVETNSTTVTFTAGLHAGALVKFTTAITLSSGVTTADLVTYDPPFTGSVTTNVEDKLAEYINVKDFGAVGDGVADDTTAFVAAATETDYYQVTNGSYVVNLTTSNAAAVLDTLSSLSSDVPLSINLAAGEYTFTQPISFGNNSSVSLIGATPTVANITAGTPSVAVTAIDAYFSTYDVTLNVASSAGISIGDWVIVEATGVNLSYTSYDETQNGARYFELNGFWEVTGTTATSITFKNRSRQSANKFPGAGTVAAATANVTGGTITKLGTIFSFVGVSGLSIVGQKGYLTNIGIVGDKTGTDTVGVNIDSTSIALSNQFCTLGAYNLGVANFTGPGVNVSGANASFNGERVFSSGHGTHGFRVDGANATITYSGASGCGDTVGNGFFASNSASLHCSNSFANGVRNTGFISNRSSTITAENCKTIGNGNYAYEVAGGWADAEGKGFECETNSQMTCNDSVSIFQTSINFYCLAGSNMSAFRCVGNAAQHLHGFYALVGSSIAARYSVAMRNVGRGFYAYRACQIAAGDSRALTNAIDYVAQGAGTIEAINYLEPTSTFNVPINCGGANQIIDSGSFDIGTKLILTKGATLTIASGVITVTHSYHLIDTEGGAPIDDLDTINGGVDGEIIVLRLFTTLRDIVVKSGTGNIVLAGGADITLTNLRDKITLMYDSLAAQWTELAFSDNAA